MAMETEQAETEPKEMEQAEAEKKETGMPPGNPVKKKRRISRTVIVFLFLINLLMLSSGLYVAWTTYYDNDLIEPFACSYVESDMHAREAASTFKDIADRAENVYSRSSTFFSGYVDFGYCVKLKEAYGGKIFSNLSNRTNSFSDENIADLVREKYAATSAVSEGSNVSPNDKQIYEDCYWWETVNGEVIFSSNYGKSRVEVPETLLESKKIEKIGICFSREILSEKEKNWKEYVSLIYLFLALLVLGGVFSLYFGAKLISCGRLPAFLKHCFLEVPIGLFFAGIIFLYLCYEHKISVFVSRNRMELLQTSLGSVQLTVSICVGALVLTGGFLLSFLGLFMIAAAIKDQEARNPSLVRILYDQCSEDRKGKAAFEKIKRSLKRNFLKVLKGWKIFWGLFTGNAIQGHTIADRERKRVFCFTGAVMFCLHF